MSASRFSTTRSNPSLRAAWQSISQALVRQIKQIKPRGSTDLHGGWAEGGRQAETGLVSDGVNRVILLSDGLANTGVVDPNTLAAEARGLAARGVGTTTMGMGDDYNEDLMEAMARAADGHYYYVESPTQLVDIFQTELQGLMDTIGQKVSLGLEPRAGAMVTEVLNDLQRTTTGRLMLPNLLVGMPALVAVRLKLPPSPGRTNLLDVRLAWDAPRNGGRRVLGAALGGLPARPMAAWLNLPEDPDVRMQVALLMAARARKRPPPPPSVVMARRPGNGWLSRANAFNRCRPHPTPRPSSRPSTTWRPHSRLAARSRSSRVPSSGRTAEATAARKARPSRQAARPKLSRRWHSWACAKIRVTTTTRLAGY